jgi:HEAT repeat protein
MRLAPLPALVIALTLMPTLPAHARHRPAKGPVGETQVTALAECGAKRDSACIREQMDALKGIGTMACPTLASTFTATPEAGQLALADALVALKCSEVADVARAAFANRDSDNRGPLAVSFAASKSEALLPEIQQLVESGRPYDREKGCEALAILGLDAAVPGLVKATGHGLYSVRQQAAKALGAFQGEAARNALCTLVAEDSNIGVRIEATRALATQKDPQSVPCLIKGLGDSSGPVKTAAHKALNDVTGLDVGIEVEAWQKWWEKNQSTGRQGKWR